MKPEKLILEWMDAIDLEAQALDLKERQCRFQALDRFEVSIEWPRSTSDLFVVLDMMSTGIGELRKRRLEKAMQLNVYGLRTRGAVIGWDELNDRIVLSYRVLLDGLDIYALNATITNLLEVGVELEAELEMRHLQPASSTQELQSQSALMP
ncbi:CesT family type III secretion system chaperone [Limnohabitans sp. 2KL-3]|uniref:CesT family type III secretion system chaperone n=1 Tax=Limnohabitans sp. 2KL-3 TaxID=1100700 RepID=UPI000A7EAFEB|nr:CesT family type III secretion system chaperone [Limnohabitans sp. 2KL-3]